MGEACAKCGRKEEKHHKGEKHHKEGKKEKHGKHREEKQAVLMDRQEAVAMLEQILAGLRSGSVAVRNEEGESIMAVPEQVQVKVKGKNKKEEVSLSMKLMWSARSGDAVEVPAEEAPEAVDAE
ncbi:MAG: amphi-Trp domain-containing protein [Thermodesulfobacteriota bacterium]